MNTTNSVNFLVMLLIKQRIFKSKLLFVHFLIKIHINFSKEKKNYMFINREIYIYILYTLYFTLGTSFKWIKRHTLIFIEIKFLA